MKTSFSSLSRRSRWIIGLTFLAIFLTGFGVNVVHRSLYRSSEFPAFRKFTRLGAFEKRDMYTEMEHSRYYPPFFTIVFSLFSWSNVFVGTILFYVTCCILFFLSVAACVHGVWEGQEGPPDKLYVMAMIMGGGIFLDVIARCESDVLVLAPLCVAFYLLSRKKMFEAGLLVSLAAAIKLTSICFLPYFLYKRQFKALLGGLIGIVLFFVLIPSLVWGIDGNYRLHKSWCEHVITAYHREGPRALVPDAYRDSNQSLTGALSRYLTHTPARQENGGKRYYVNLLSLQDRTVEIIVRALQIMIIAVVAIACRFKTDDRLLLGMEYSLVLIAILELCGISWTSHHVVLLLPYTVAVGYLLQHVGGEAERNVSLIKKGTILSLILMCLAIIPILKSLSALFFATMIMFVTFSVVLLRQRRSAGADGESSPSVPQTCS